MHSLRGAIIFPTNTLAIPKAALKFGTEVHQNLSSSYDSHSNNPWQSVVYIRLRMEFSVYPKKNFKLFTQIRYRRFAPTIVSVFWFLWPMDHKKIPTDKGPFRLSKYPTKRFPHFDQIWYRRFSRTDVGQFQLSATWIHKKKSSLPVNNNQILHDTTDTWLLFSRCAETSLCESPSTSHAYLYTAL